jgi:hypothetical protein
MNKGVEQKSIILVTSLVFLFALAGPHLVTAQNFTKGNIVGFLYDKDGATPLEGGVVKFKNLTTGTIYESSKSDGNGIFKVQDIDSGIYTYGVLTADGDFNADNLVALRIQERETAKMSIALSPYTKEVASAVTEFYREPQIAGETLVGTITEFDASSQMAKVQVVKGLLRVNDKIHAKGKSTDFYQQVNVLKAGNSSTKRVVRGETASLKLTRKAARGDLVYVVINKNLFPLFLAPLGVASLMAGSTAVNYGIVKVNDEIIPVSAHKNK